MLHLQDISSKLEEEYASVHFPKAQTDLCSNVKTSGHHEPKHVEEEDVQYSEVSFHRPSSAPRSATTPLQFILKLLSLTFSLFLCFEDIFAKAALLTLFFPPYLGQLVPWTVLMQSTAQSSRNLSLVFLSSDVVLLVEWGMSSEAFLEPNFSTRKLTFCQQKLDFFCVHDMNIFYFFLF